mgnify:CR=1 FL=1
MSLIDIEELGTKHLRVTDPYRGIPKDTLTKYILDITKYVDSSISKTQWKHLLTEFNRKYHINPGAFQLNYQYRIMLEKGEIERNAHFELFNSARHVRVDSGVVVASLLMSGTPNDQVFTCAHNCYFCPNEKPSEENNWTQQPRSYLMKEPAVLRANRNGFDTVMQIHDRLSTISLSGHNVDKVEIIALGGTFSCYPEDYQESFTRDVYYAANTFFDNRETPRERLSVEEEIKLNETARVRIIGYTIEDRPDYCNNAAVFQKYRRFGVTRIQVGIQHTNQQLLDKVNRGCTKEDAEVAIQNAKDSCFKIDGHWMPDLPGATPEMDWEMFQDVIYSKSLQLDQWKIYPCETVDHTEIKRWFESVIEVFKSTDYDIEFRRYFGSPVIKSKDTRECIRKMKPIIGDINRVLSKQPTKHTIIFIKERLRCAKTLVKKYIGLEYERYSGAKNDEVSIQGIRATGYNHNPKMTIFANRSSIANYQMLFDTRFLDNSVEWRSGTTKYHSQLKKQEAVPTFLGAVVKE